MVVQSGNSYRYPIFIYMTKLYISEKAQFFTHFRVLLYDLCYGPVVSVKHLSKISKLDKMPTVQGCTYICVLVWLGSAL